MSRKNPIIVTGTAGTGTRVFSDLLECAGVFMGHRRNPTRDNLDFIAFVKDGIPISDKDSPLGDNFLNQARSTNYDPSVIRPLIQLRARSMVRQFSNKLLEDLKPEHYHWGWKESQSMFVLPFLLEVFPDLRLVHVVRDGRDMAFSNQQRAPFQVGYILSLMGLSAKPTNDDIWARYVARTWELTNVGVSDWAQRNLKSDQYIVAKLEDLQGNVLETTKTLFEKCEISVDDVAKCVEISGFDPPMLRLRKYKSRDKDVVRDIEQDVRIGLEKFHYQLEKNNLFHE